jgi:hypothetical protein
MILRETRLFILPDIFLPAFGPGRQSQKSKDQRISDHESRMNLQNRKDEEKSGPQDDQDSSIGLPKHSPAMHPVKPENLQGKEQDADEEKALAGNLG